MFHIYLYGGIEMTRSELLSTEEGIILMITKWDEYIRIANQALAQVTAFNDELNNYFIENKPLSKNSIARMGGFRRVNNMMGIYTNDLHKHLKSVDSVLIPNYPNSHIPKLKAIDAEAQEWKKAYNKAVSLYYELKECYRLSLYRSDGTFDIASWV